MWRLMSQYYRLKKYCELKRERSVHKNGNRSNENHLRININSNEISTNASNASNIVYNVGINASNTVDNEKDMNDDQLLNASDCEFALVEDSLKSEGRNNNKILHSGRQKI